MKLTCISDLHGEKPKLPGGDLLFVVGDLTARDTPEQHEEFKEWLLAQNYKRKVLVAGNHDNHIQKSELPRYDDGIDYLQDLGTEFEGLKIWGSPWTKKFYRQNPAAMAFALDTDQQMREKWELIPEGIDILVTHSPPMGILDNAHNMRCGCPELRKVVGRIAPKYHIFGHIHSHGGMTTTRDGCTYINAAYMDEGYRPIHEIVTLEI